MDQVGQLMLEGPLRVDLSINVSVPASWSKKKHAQAMDGERWATGRPDVDNVSKLALDALNGILWKDDAQVCCLSVVRQYAAAPAIIMTVTPL